MKRPIAISLSPNVELSDVLIALRLLVTPWNLLHGKSVKLLEQWFRQYFNTSHAVAFNSGRSSLFAILKALGITQGDEVLMQAFTCVVVPNCIIWIGARPVYVDIQSDLTMSIKDLEKKITKKTKAIIVQHTFGIPTNMDAIAKIAKQYKLLVIEDCAHTLGGEYNQKKLGIQSNAAFFSFGRDKPFSSVFGGMAITNDAVIGKNLKIYQRQLQNPSFLWVVQQIFHPVAFSIILPLYNLFSIGKGILVVLQRLHLLSFPVSQPEKEGKEKGLSVKKFSNAMAAMAIFQLKRVKQFNSQRESIANCYITRLQKMHYDMIYNKKIPYLRFPLIVSSPQEVVNFFKKKGIYIGRWYSEVIDPKGVVVKKIFYEEGSCPQAELIAKSIINLPTYPVMTLKEAEQVMDLFEEYVTNRRNKR